MPHTTGTTPLRPNEGVVCAQVAALVNEVYAATESPMWRPGVQRTSVDEVRSLAKELLEAWCPRLGYRLVRTHALADAHPHLLEAFVVPAVVDRYERHL